MWIGSNSAAFGFLCLSVGGALVMGLHGMCCDRAVCPVIGIYGLCCHWAMCLFGRWQWASMLHGLSCHWVMWSDSMACNAARLVKLWEVWGSVLTSHLCNTKHYVRLGRGIFLCVSMVCWLGKCSQKCFVFELKWTISLKLFIVLCLGFSLFSLMHCPNLEKCERHIVSLVLCCSDSKKLLKHLECLYSAEYLVATNWNWALGWLCL